MIPGVEHSTSTLTKTSALNTDNPEINVNAAWTTYTSPLGRRRDNSLYQIDTWGNTSSRNQATTSRDIEVISISSNSSTESFASVEIIPPPQVVQLSVEQRQVLSIVEKGENVFFTGPAGTGKSVLLKEIIKSLPTTHSVAVTAPTGIAGLNIGGCTVHSWAGIGLGTESAEDLIQKITGSKFFSRRWRVTKTLIIDEISMLDATLFDKLECIARAVRKSTKPFGGIQLVLSGDFFQLPPVPQQSHNFYMPATYAFDANSWDKCIGGPVFLSQVFRQKDNDFISILAAMRSGNLSSEHISQLKQLSRPLTYGDGIEPSELFPLRAEVESCNNKRLNELTGCMHTYRAIDKSGYDIHHNRIAPAETSQLLQRLIALREISLKVGAQVMLIQNVKQGQLVNGSVGKLEEFLTINQARERAIEIAEIQKPGESDGKRRLIGQEELIPMGGTTIFSEKQAWPLVRFTNGQTLLCAPLKFTVEGLIGNVEAERMQVPLILAWALSIHKAQGQTLSRVKVNLKRIFEKGQAYVALSRATTMESLEIQNFDPAKIAAHPRVLAWHQSWLENVASVIDDDDLEMDCDEAIASYHSHTGFSWSSKLMKEAS